MANIKQIRLNDTDYDIADARIVNGVIEVGGSVSFSGTGLFIGSCFELYVWVFNHDNILDVCENAGMDLDIGLGADGCTVTNVGADTATYIAILTD